MTAPTFSLDIRSFVDVKATLQGLALPPAKRRRVLSKAGDRLAAQNRTRLRGQRNLDGSAFKPRKGGSKHKMLRGLVKGLKRLSTDANHTKLGWQHRSVSRIASEHQHGQTQLMTAARMRRLSKSSSYSEPPSRKQAKALLAAGYRVRVGHRWRRPTQSWVMENLHAGQVGLLLNRLDYAGKKQRWRIELPPRHVLGADRATVSALLNTVLQNTLNAP